MPTINYDTLLFSLVVGFVGMWILHRLGYGPKWLSLPFEMTSYHYAPPEELASLRALNTHVFAQWGEFLAFAAPHQLDPEVVERLREFWLEETLDCPPGHTTVFVVTPKGAKPVDPEYGAKS